MTGPPPLPERSPPPRQAQRSTARPVRRPPPRRRSLIRTLAGYLAMTMLFVVVAVTTFLLVAPPVDIVRERLIADFQARTGYLLEINGQTTLRLVPGPSVEFRDVVVATPGEGGSQVLRIESIEVEPQVSALLRGKVQVDRVIVRRPQLDLVIDAEGRRKWLRPNRHADLQSVRVAQLKDGQLKDGDAAGRFAPSVLRDVADAAPREELPVRKGNAAAIPSIRISDGIVRYRDLRTGNLIQSDQVQLRVIERSGKDARLAVAGTFAYAGETVKVQLQAALPEGSRSRRADRIALKLDARHGTASYDGSVELSERALANGSVDISTKDAREAMRWFGLRSRDASLTGPLSFKGRIDAQGDRTAIEQMSFSVEGAKADGRITIDHGGIRPRFAADLNFAELDIDRLRAKVEQQPADRAQRRQSKERTRDVRRVETATAPAAPPSESDDAENDPASGALLPRGRAWRTEPIPFVTLGNADGDARIRASRLVWRGATLMDAAGNLNLADGAMKIDLREGTMHGGRARGVITASTSGHVGIDLALDEVSALETLSNSGRFEVLEGPARIRLAVAGHGATEKEIVDTLAGTATIEITKGAIRGWSIDDILATARRLQMPNLKRDADARTRFERLSATVVIKDGVATGKDMRIAASPISLDSSGTIDLKSRTLELTLSPRIASDAATGANGRFAGLSVPLQLNGPWNRPRLSADFQSILKSPQKAIEAAREAVSGVKDEDIDKAAKRFLGDTPEAEKGAKRAKELLKRFLDR